MPTDRTRPSDDRLQGYRGVRFQQGRVILDRDLNAGEEIAAEELRDVTRDVVGPVGSPDDGFKIGPPNGTKKFDFTIEAGTYYLGGVRVTLDKDASYFTQPDWLDPDWVAKADEEQLMGQAWNEFVGLHVQEVEVAMREDEDLADVGLGGPDSAGRLRLLVRVVRMQTKAADCQGAFDEATKQWKEDGFVFDKVTNELVPHGQLAVGFPPDATGTNLCQPEASGGYLHPDNQFIRVKRVRRGKADQLLWGFDNASFLYRVDGKPTTTTVKITPPPPDATRFPKQDQFVEVLRAAVKLPEGGYVAEPEGIVAQLTSGYNADTGTIVLDVALPDNYKTSPALFVRIWESTLDLPATKAPLVAVSDPSGATGLTVTVPATGSGLGAYWTFAPRPSTPQEVYPKRYSSAQPPDGPRVWVAPLAFLKWDKEGQLATSSISDCRDVFENLVELTKRKPGSGGGCCTITVRPEDIKKPGDLKELLKKGMGDSKQPVRMCFQPGTYQLIEPLLLTKAHRGIAVEGCIGVIWEMHPDAKPTEFLDGLIVLADCDDVTIRGVTFRPPAVLPLDEFKSRKVPPKQFNALLKDFGSVRTAIAIRAINSSRLTVAACQFEYPDTAEVEDFGAGLLAHGDCTGLSVTGCQFRPAGAGRQLGPHTKLTIAKSQANLATLGRAFRAAADKKSVPRLLGDTIATFEDKAKGETFVNPAVGPTVPAGLEWEKLPAWATQHSNYVYLRPDTPAALTEPHRVLAYEQPTKGAVGVNVLFGSGQAAFLSIDMARVVIQATGAKFNAVQERSALRAWVGVMLWHTVQIPPNPDQEFILRPVVEGVTLADNHFDGLTVPYWSIGHAGAVSIHDNRVTDCNGGFWQMNPDHPQEFVNHVPEAKLGFVVADAFPLPPAKSPIPVFRDSKLGPLRGVFQVTNNNVDAKPSDGTVSGPAVFFHGDSRTGVVQRIMTLVTGNHLTNADTVRATVVVWEAHWITVTGNMAANDGLVWVKDAAALDLLPLTFGNPPGVSVAITGNLFSGSVNWEKLFRDPAVGKPHENWKYYNSETT